MKCPQCLTPLDVDAPRCRCGVTLTWARGRLERVYDDGQVVYQRRRNCDTAWEDGWTDTQPQIRPHGARVSRLGLVISTLGGAS